MTTEEPDLETAVLMYLDLLDPTDKHFLKPEDITNTGELLIKYLKSGEYVEYRKLRQTFDAKYMNVKKYGIVVGKKKVAAYKRDKDGKLIDKAIEELERPTLISVSHALEKHATQLQLTRGRLAIHYNQLIGVPTIDPAAKAKFIKEREGFIKKLNDYYAVQYYYHKINGMIQTEKQVHLPLFNKRNGRIESVPVFIDSESMDTIYRNDSMKLDLYNKIKEAMLLGSDDVKTLIKEYHEFDKMNAGPVQALLEKKKKHKRLSYVVIPPGAVIPDNGLIKPREYKPFFNNNRSNSVQNHIPQISQNSNNMAANHTPRPVPLKPTPEPIQSSQNGGGSDKPIALPWAKAVKQATPVP